MFGNFQQYAGVLLNDLCVLIESWIKQDTISLTEMFRPGSRPLVLLLMMLLLLKKRYCKGQHNSVLLAHQLVTSGLLARPKFYPSYPIIGNSVIIMARTSKDDLNKIWNFVLLTAYTNFNHLPTHFLIRYSKHTAITKYILQIPFEKY